MGDYPDYTDVMQIIGSDIMVPIDLQAAYIMMPIDIQAQYVTLDIDIVAQTVGNITVDIAAQNVGNITIDIEAQSVGVYLMPDWAVKVGDDLSVYGHETIAHDTWTDIIDYENTSGKTFYITQWSVNVWADALLLCYLEEEYDETTNVFCVGGGKIGFAQSFTRPIPIPNGRHAVVQALQAVGTSATVDAAIQGYLA